MGTKRKALILSYDYPGITSVLKKRVKATHFIHQIYGFTQEVNHCCLTYKIKKSAAVIYKRYSDIMARRTQTLVVGFAMLMVIMRTAHCNECLDGTESCCTMCNKGYLLQRDGDSDCGICKRCTDRWYKSQPSNEPYCNKCRICTGVFEYEKPCMATSNAVCKCVPGKKCVGENCEKCVKIQCKAGQELINGKCMNCTYGKYNPGTDGECKTWKSCENGNSLLNGTSSSDVVCGGIVTKTTERSTTTSSTSTEVKSNPEVYNIGMLIAYIAIPLVLMLFAMMIISRHILICVEKIKNKFKKLPVQHNQPIQPILIKIPDQEDACSCHYPEEEQGNELLN